MWFFCGFFCFVWCFLILLLLSFVLFLRFFVARSCWGLGKATLVPEIFEYVGRCHKDSLL